MLYTDRVAQVRRKVADILYRAEQLYGLDMSRVHVRLDLRGRSAGQAGCKRSQGGATSNHYVRFNVDMIAGSGFDHIYNETIPHEIAHIVCYMNPSLGNDHSPGWKRVCVALGGTGERCHNQPVVYAKGNTYAYISTGGVTVNLSQQRHRKIQQGVVYELRRGGLLNKTCRWSHHVAAAETIAAPVAATNTERKASTGTKADQIRREIAVAKGCGYNEDTVIRFAVGVLGMSKSLAKTYVRNNWDQV